MVSKANEDLGLPWVLFGGVGLIAKMVYLGSLDVVSDDTSEIVQYTPAATYTPPPSDYPLRSPPTPLPPPSLPRPSPLPSHPSSFPPSLPPSHGLPRASFRCAPFLPPFPPFLMLRAANVSFAGGE